MSFKSSHILYCTWILLRDIGKKGIFICILIKIQDIISCEILKSLIQILKWLNNQTNVLIE